MRDTDGDKLRQDESRDVRGLIPAKVSENPRATVTAGLAKLVDAVNQYAPVI